VVPVKAYVSRLAARPSRAVWHVLAGVMFGF